MAGMKRAKLGNRPQQMPPLDDKNKAAYRRCADRSARLLASSSY